MAKHKHRPPQHAGQSTPITPRDPEPAPPKRRPDRLLLLAAGLAVTLMLVLLLAGCNEADITGDTTPDGPLCAEVWVEGEALPADYSGCYSGNGEPYIGSEYDCADGTKWTFYQDRLAAVYGEKIVKPANGVTLSDACLGHGGVT